MAWLRWQYHPPTIAKAPPMNDTQAQLLALSAFVNGIAIAMAKAGILTPPLCERVAEHAALALGQLAEAASEPQHAHTLMHAQLLAEQMGQTLMQAAHRGA